MEERIMPKYRLGHTFRDKGSSADPEDEFLRWINIPASGIRNMGGIRPLKFTQLKLPVQAYIVLVTVDRPRKRLQSVGRPCGTP